LDGHQYDCSGLVDDIIKQDYVGSVVKTAEDDDPIALFTVMNTLMHKNKEWMKQVREFLTTKCCDAALKDKVKQAFDQQGTALLINERLINAPPKLAPPLMQFLFEEVKEASKDKELADDVRQSFKLQRYLVATRVYEDRERQPTDGAGPSRATKKSRMAPVDDTKQPSASGAAGPSGSSAGGSTSGTGKQVIVYLRPEDEFLHKHASWSYTFPVEGRPVGKDDLLPLRLVMLVDASKVQAARAALDSVVGNMAAGVV